MGANITKPGAPASDRGGSDAGTPYNRHENYAYEVELMVRMLGMTRSKR